MSVSFSFRLLFKLTLCSEIKAQALFEQETNALKFPQFQDGSFASNFKLGLFDYLSLIRTRTLLYRVAVGSM